MFDPRLAEPLERPANWTCPRTAPYEPILAIPMEVRFIDPDWADCVGGISGAYDPPIALTPVSAIAKPTVPGSNRERTTTAVPASSPLPAAAPITSSIQSSTPAATATMESAPEPVPNGSHLNAASTLPATNDEQAIDHDISSGRQTLDPTLPPDSNKGPDSQATQAPVVPSITTDHSLDGDTATMNDPTQHNTIDSSDQSHATSKDPGRQTDALSILLAAQSSIDDATGDP
jgi:hypothetical protein